MDYFISQNIHDISRGHRRSRNEAYFSRNFQYFLYFQYSSTASLIPSGLAHSYSLGTRGKRSCIENRNLSFFMNISCFCFHLFRILILQNQSLYWISFSDCPTYSACQSGAIFQNIINFIIYEVVYVMSCTKNQIHYNVIKFI